MIVNLSTFKPIICETTGCLMIRIPLKDFHLRCKLCNVLYEKDAEIVEDLYYYIGEGPYGQIYIECINCGNKEVIIDLGQVNAKDSCEQKAINL